METTVPWPWPLAPLSLIALLAVAAIVLSLVYRYAILGEE
jgi:hypothetical protein